jgi:hypothetical protein
MLRTAVFALALACDALCAQSTGKITGKITDAVTRQPIGKVHVGCMSGGQFAGVLSAVDGSYALEDVPAGDIRMTVNLEGYKLVSGDFEPTAEFRLAAGAAVMRDFAMHPLGRIYGRLTDRDSGQALEGRTVFAALRQYVPGRIFYMQLNQSPTKNGSFEVKDLEAGDYKVEIESPGEPAFVLKQEQAPRGALSVRVYGHRYYPDVPRPEMAASIRLGEGESLRLDISLQAHEPHSLSGVVVAPREFERQPVSLSLLSGDSFPAPPKQMPAPGPFRFENLAPGIYRLALTAGEPPNQLAGDYEIEIGDHDVENFKAALFPEAGVAGQLRMLEPDAIPPNGLSVNFVSLDGWISTFGKRGMIVSAPPPGIASVPVKAAAFHETSIRPGDYWPVASNIPSGYAVAEIRFEGSSPLRNFMTLSAPDTPLTIVLTSRPGAVAGFVRDENDRAVPGAMVELFPDPLPEKIAPTTVRFTESTEGGAFAFKDVPPGSYRALAIVSDLDFRNDDASMRAMLAKAEVFKVRPGQSATVNLKR